MANNWPFKRYLFFVKSGQHMLDIYCSWKIPLHPIWWRSGEMTSPRRAGTVSALRGSGYPSKPARTWRSSWCGAPVDWPPARSLNRRKRAMITSFIETGALHTNPSLILVLSAVVRDLVPALVVDGSECRPHTLNATNKRFHLCGNVTCIRPLAP